MRHPKKLLVALCTFAAVMAIVFALVAIRETRQLVEAGGSRPAVAAQTARFMGYVWAWGALGLVISYGSGVVSWREWLTFFVAFAILAAASLWPVLSPRGILPFSAALPWWTMVSALAALHRPLSRMPRPPLRFLMDIPIVIA